ncbi:MAG: hypothetical protein KatS3mg110_0248 [Pirellulaceae bacterium]|nr:MAG: hypothetical protein KatS3mg110_0248 [Pirellulaceae bacterium]
MPEGEKFWNPYRWVEVSREPVERDVPYYHHCFQGLSGRIDCTLQALTPLIINDGKGQFVTDRRGKPFIPATSLKGVIRSLAELIGNACVPFPHVDVDPDHQLSEARQGQPGNQKFDIVARTFGYLESGNAFAGLIYFSDAELISDTPLLNKGFAVAVGKPDPNHKSFYPDKKRRKFYHHIVDTEELTPPHAGITQTVTVRPISPGAQFAFQVNFVNLRDEELNLLLYCLVLEENVTVTLRREALHPEAKGPCTLSGPMRHKIGFCKPHGAGSVHIRVTKLTVRTDPSARYRGRDTACTFENEELHKEVTRRIATFVSRMDVTMQQLRAMMIYTRDDPRKPVNYPTYQWFQQDKRRPDSDKRKLKPTL